jgi:RPA family protein
MNKREPAWRVFAGEYNDATLEVKGSGEKTPSYVITPLGAKINRVFIVGVLTDVEPISEGGEMLRAHVSDPTGVFTLYSGQYQQEATDALQRIEVPSFLAVVGKTRTYRLEDQTLYVSLRPEYVREVDAHIRDQWIIETCKHTKDRIHAVLEAKKMNPANVYDLNRLGYSKELAEGVVAAVKHYSNIDLHRYIAMIQESLQYLVPDREQVKTIVTPKREEDKKTEKMKTEKMPKASDKIKSEEKNDPEGVVLEVIRSIEDEEGAAWDEIINKCKEKGLTEDDVEEALSSLMDKGLIYEPILGLIKTT